MDQTDQANGLNRPNRLNKPNRQKMAPESIENRNELINILVSRVAENAPIKEHIRVYCEALTANLKELDDGELIQGILNAGYLDIMERFNLGEIALETDL